MRKTKIVILPDQYGVLVKLHHLIGDAWTLALLGNQFNELINGTVPEVYSYHNHIEEEDKYETVGNDCAKKQESIGLCSYIKNQEIDLYNVNSTPAFREGFEFDLEAFNFYLKKSDYFRGGADFRTALPEEQRYSGDYGIAYELVFKDATGSEKVITYKINIDDMEGNPYLLTVASKQYCI